MGILIANNALHTQITAGELRNMRGDAGRVAAQKVFESMLDSRSVMAGALDEVHMPNSGGTRGNTNSTSNTHGEKRTRISIPMNSSSLLESPLKKVAMKPSHAEVSSADEDVIPPATNAEELRIGKRKKSRVGADSAGRTPKHQARGAGHERQGGSKKHALLNPPTPVVPAATVSPGEKVESSAQSAAEVRKAKWLEAVQQNDSNLKAIEKRLREEEEKATECHSARTMELMQWMVAEQSGEHDDTGSEGPPAMKKDDESKY